MEKRIIIIGATSGIGKALAEEMHRRGYIVGLTGRRVERLEEIKTKLGTRVHTQFMDVVKTEEARNQLQTLINIMHGMDCIVLNAGVSDFKEGINWDKERQVVDVNVRGFTSLANFSFDYFEKEGHGTMVGMSSIASLFGYGLSAAYNASKAYVSTYLQGYRQRANHSDADISVIDIKPGFVESEIIENMEDLFWVAKTDVAARQIANAIEKNKNRLYVTKRWRLAAWLLKITPNWILDRM